MGTVAGLRTRRYHGLLAVAVDGPGSRNARPRRARPGARRRRRALPARHGRVGGRHRRPARATSCSSRSTSSDGVPRWRWQIGGILLERELAMAHGSPAVGVVHRLLAPDRPVRLELTPLCTWRERARRAARERRARRSSRPTAASSSSGAYRVAGAGWEAGGAWYRDVRAREEAARGLGDREDLWAAGTFAVDLEPGACHEVTAAAAPFDGTLPAATEIVAAARSARGRAARRARARPTTSTRSSCSPPTSSRSRPPAARPPSPAIRGSASGRAT